MIEKLKNLPEQSGIYQFFDKGEKLLYIGKAKNLKSRVKSYFKFTPFLSAATNLSPRINKMISETVGLEYIILENEIEALILENSLIKQLKPKYNILLRDDKTYPYICIDLEEDFPRFEITRKLLAKKDVKYFGPYSVGAKEILDVIYELFKLVQKKSCLNSKKACLFYQINKCLAPCEGKIDKEQYKQIIQNALEILKDKNKLIKLLEIKMYKEANGLLFEEAAKTRDNIEKIKKINTMQNIDLLTNENIDIFAIAINDEGNRAVGVKVFVRNGKIISLANSIFKSDNGFEKDELYKRFLLDYYLNIPLIIPQNIIVYEDYIYKQELEEFILSSCKTKVTVMLPQKGKKRKLVNLAYKNAYELLLKEKCTDDSFLIQLKELFNLSKVPYNIEIFDNSHIRGEASVGAMVKWDNGFIKKDYRHYILEAKDEYSQMRETLIKRVESFYKNPPPDLWIIDGGETLRNLANEIIKLSGVNVDVIAISKDKENGIVNRAKVKANDKIYSQSSIFKLSNSDKRLQFIQKLRDESHRFVLNFHRGVKSKKDNEVALLKQRGIGEAKLKKLITFFGTFDKIKNATYDELIQVIDSKSVDLIIKNYTN